MLLVPLAAHAATLDAVRARGHVVCGVSEGAPGFSDVAANGTWTGLDVDFCGAVAAAVLGRKDAVKYRALTPANRFQALKNGEVDLLAHAATWTLSRDTDLGARFAGPIFYDGQGFMVRRGYAVASVLELSGASICVMSGTSAEQAVADYFRARQMQFRLVVSARWEDAVKTYADGGCTILTGDISTLGHERSRFAMPGDHVIMPEVITKEPHGPAVRQDDEQWFSIVRWTLFALVAAEELGLTHESVEEGRSSPLVDVRRFVGAEGNLGQGMGLEADWSYQIVRQTGNYGEMFDRNVGARSPLGLDRGVNNLWTKGGLMYVPPLR
jgi:general L-amino acid transport system substrate-binding protein